jgi:ABC-type polysaccharide/polyol phosphate export permease
MIELVRQLRRHWDLLYMITWRDIRIRYKQSVMGFFWAILMPVLIVAAGVVVKVGMAQVSGKPLRIADLMTVTLKALPWAFFVGSIRFSSASLLANSRLVAKIAFPRAVFPISAVLSQAFDFAVASVALAALLAAGSVGTSLQLMWVPVLLALLFLLVAGLALLLSAANLFFRDVKYIVDVILTFAIFFTPVFFDVALFGPRGWILMLNPIAPILEGLKAAVIEHRSPDALWTLYSAGVSLALAWVAPAVFLRLEPRFAECI